MSKPAPRTSQFDSRRVFLSAGEASGDAYGAALVEELRKLQDGIQFQAIGGRKLRDAGVSICADSSHWGAIGIWQSFWVGLKAVFRFLRVKRILAKGPPGLFIPIDFGFMNIRLARQAKMHGWKVLYFVPPGSWRRDRQGGDVAELSDAISTPFPWSAELFRSMGANAYWFGHPIKQIGGLASRNVRGETIAVLPGSRNHEIKNNLPVIAAAIAGQVEFALAPSVDREQFQKMWLKLRPAGIHDVFTVGDTSGVLQRSRAAIVCSGTATLEAALCRTPMVVVYRASKAMELEAKLIGFKRPKFVSLPNIVLDRGIVPELIQEAATQESVRKALQELLVDGPMRTAQLNGFDEIDTLLGREDAITHTAKLALGLLG